VGRLGPAEEDAGSEASELEFWSGGIGYIYLEEQRAEAEVLGAFFIIIHYSHATSLDHGEDIYSPFPVRCPRSGGSLQAPLLPSAQACPGGAGCRG